MILKNLQELCVGVLGSQKDKLYIQTRNRGCVIKTNIPLQEIDCWNIREPR